MALRDKTVALAEGRQLEDLAALLEKEGAKPQGYPLLSILDAPDADPVNAWIDQFIASEIDWVIWLTGEGIRRLSGFAERSGRHEEWVAALGRVPCVTRGPKPASALKKFGISPTKSASAPTTAGVIETLRALPLDGKTVGVQLYAETNKPLSDYLASIGAKVAMVLPYVYAPAADAGRVGELIDRLTAGQIDIIVFTSSPQFDRLQEVSFELGKEQALLDGLAKTFVASVGPIVTQTLRDRGVRVDLQPEQGFQMKNLVVQMRKHFAATDRQE